MAMISFFDSLLLFIFLKRLLSTSLSFAVAGGWGGNWSAGVAAEGGWEAEEEGEEAAATIAVG